MTPRVLLLTGRHPDDGVGGVETFARFLAFVFPGLSILSARDVKPRPERGRFRERRLARGLARAAVRSQIEEGFDLVVANGSLAMDLPSPLPGRPAPVVVVLHGNYAGYCRSAMRECSWKTWYTRWIASDWEARSARRADRVVAVSAGVRDDIRLHYGTDATVIENGVPVPTVPFERSAARRELGLEGDAPCVLFSGRATREKGYDRLLALAAARPEIRFAVATPTAPPILAPNVRAFEDPRPETLARLYAAADVLAFPSRFEGCAYAPLEAMAAGTPVLSGATGSFAGMSGRFEGGWIVNDAASTRAWSEGLSRLLGLEDRRSPREYVLARHSYEGFSRAYRDLARSLTSSSWRESAVHA